MNEVVTCRAEGVGTVKLGRLRPKALPLCLSLSNYLEPTAVAIPDSVKWSTKAAASLSRMYKNDQLGCCVISSKYHQIGLWTGNDTANVVTVSDNLIVATYNKLKAGPGDSGCNITDVLNYMKATGLNDDTNHRHKIAGYVAVNNKVQQLAKAGLWLFGGLCLGLNLPSAWLDAPVWDVTTSQIVGGHDVLAVDYDSQYVYVATWGGIRKMTWAAFTNTQWTEECYALLAPDWTNDDNMSPAGVDVAGLQADLAKLGGGSLPDIGPTPPPPPPPPPPPGGWSFTVSGTGTKPVITWGA